MPILLGMIGRALEPRIREELAAFPVVGLVGPRQIGKTTLALAVEATAGKPVVHLDLERPSDLARLHDPELYLRGLAGTLVVLDEVQRLPEIFPLLRSLVDERRRAGEPAGHFLILGSALARAVAPVFRIPGGSHRLPRTGPAGMG
jgi:predicted AAA+ superfamily ATPase